MQLLRICSRRVQGRYSATMEIARKLSKRFRTWIYMKNNYRKLYKWQELRRRTGTNARDTNVFIIMLNRDSSNIVLPHYF